MEPSDFLDILLRKKWLIIFSFLLIFFVALVYSVVTTDLYKSSARILIIPPSVAEGMVQTTVQMDVSDRLKAIQIDVLGGVRLTKVIHEIGIQKLGFEGMPEPKMHNEMRKRISLEADLGERGWRAQSGVKILTLSFLHKDPDVAQEVVSFLSSLFMDENIRLRESFTTETAGFLNQQLEETRKRLEVQENRLKQYKLQHSGELPQQEQFNFTQLTRLREQIKSNSDAILRLQDRRLFLESQASAFGGGMSSVPDTASVAASSDAGVPVALLAELSTLQKKLADLKQRYTEKHPAVVQAQLELTRIEEQIALAREEAKKNPNKKLTVTNAPSIGASKEVSELSRIQEQIARIDLDIIAMKRESEDARIAMNRIQSKIEKLPQREQELISLTRDYENTKKLYDELLDKKLKASISKNLEEDQKGERFQLLDPAGRPNLPSEPNRLRVFIIAFIASLMIGGGGGVALEILDPKLRGSKDFKSFFSIPVLTTLPTIQDENYNRRIAFKATAIKTGLVSILGIYVVFLITNKSKIKLILKSILATVGGG